MARASCNGGQTNCDSSWIATCDVDSNETSCNDKSLDTGREEYIYSWSGVFDTVCRIMSSLLPGGMLVVLKNCPTTVGSDNGVQAGIQLDPVN